MATIEAALSPDYAVGAPHVLTVPMGSDWPEANQAIATTARVLLAGDDTFDKRIAVFPIAPVSACLALGYHLTSRPMFVSSNIIGTNRPGRGRGGPCRRTISASPELMAKSATPTR